MLNLTQLDLLQKYLKEQDIHYERIDNSWEMDSDGFHQIQVFDNEGNQIWDAVCHGFSYGHEDGLLEVMGLNDHKNDVEGDLTAKDIICKIEGR